MGAPTDPMSEEDFNNRPKKYSGPKAGTATYENYKKSVNRFNKRAGFYSGLDKNVSKLREQIESATDLETETKNELLAEFAKFGDTPVSKQKLSSSEFGNLQNKYLELQESFSLGKEGLGKYQERRLSRKVIEEKYKVMSDQPGVGQTLIAGLNRSKGSGGGSLIGGGR
jgi:hypothetical protein